MFIIVNLPNERFLIYRALSVSLRAFKTIDDIEKYCKGFAGNRLDVVGYLLEFTLIGFVEQSPEFAYRLKLDSDSLKLLDVLEESLYLNPDTGAEEVDNDIAKILEKNGIENIPKNRAEFIREHLLDGSFNDSLEVEEAAKPSKLAECETSEERETFIERVELAEKSSGVYEAGYRALSGLQTLYGAAIKKGDHPLALATHKSIFDLEHELLSRGLYSHS
ncbi:hypothetical protein [Gloeobacter violaceus]|uniref:hypothetical protein n=1 Tax=Gloeobacter violaceus TaxID=33072 RepID=UPI000325EDD7|nr:hypothetical protein [Gloeobacter violaceus]